MRGGKFVCEVRRLTCDLRGERLRFVVSCQGFEVCSRRFEVVAILGSLVMAPGGFGSQGSPFGEGWGSREQRISLQQGRGNLWGPEACVLQYSRA